MKPPNFLKSLYRIWNNILWRWIMSHVLEYFNTDPDTVIWENANGFMIDGSENLLSVARERTFSMSPSIISTGATCSKSPAWKHVRSTVRIANGDVLQVYWCLTSFQACPFASPGNYATIENIVAISPKVCYRFIYSKHVCIMWCFSGSSSRYA